ncbi:deoxyribonuclease IV [Limisalsivibrio acetivorans]|uniref:deoxyribonuclease IV n=1 Tax=Limisalsivibrio acetivorans TaxID=1304888 RepID=UPI0003B6C80C|nr:deoxyribonuclease IV [Limisalsivibrio acetivorans]
MLIGAHESASGGVYKAVDRALADECESMQVFVKNNNRWKAKPLTDKEIEKYHTEIEKLGAGNVCTHASYLINLATDKEETYEKSVNGMKDELDRCDKLGIPYYIIHPGSHVGQGEEFGIKKIADSISDIYNDGDYKTMLLLEITAGQGTNLGYTFDQLGEIMDKCGLDERIGICLDSCHMYSAGYDIVNEYDKVFDKLFDQFPGKIKVFHLNDTKFPHASKRDRHEFIAQGEIGEDFFKRVVNDERFKDVLGVLETPVKGDDTYLEEVRLLKSYRK